MPGVQLFSVQKGPGSEQLAEVAEHWSITDLGSRCEDFADTAAALTNLDLVVTCDTAVAHCAGALGLPVWVLLPFVADWRWLLSREDSPWYPTMRLFRQRTRGDWPAVLARIASAVGDLLAERARGKTLQIEVSPGEMVERIILLETLSKHTTDPANLASVQHELSALQRARVQVLRGGDQLDRLTAELQAVHEARWETEEEIRLCEAGGNFGPHFVELARSLSQYNDRCAVLKQRIDELFGL
jgi:hypothetical protein